MLIPSDKHSRADLLLWAESEAADRVHARELLASGKIEASLTYIVDFVLQGPCYCGVSWGKDSVVLGHLVSTATPDVPLAWAKIIETHNPDCDAVRDVYLSQHPSQRYCEFPVHRVKGANEFDMPMDDGQTAGEAINTIASRRYLSGIRADESGIRSLRCDTHGVNTKNTSAPLAWWTAADVFAYLAIKGLPVHPVYAMLGGGRWERHRLRVANLGGRRGDGMGRAEWESEYYASELRRIERDSTA